MPRFRSSRTGSVVTCPADTAARMGSEWEPLEEKSKPTRKRSAKSDDE